VLTNSNSLMPCNPDASTLAVAAQPTSSSLSTKTHKPSKILPQAVRKRIDTMKSSQKAESKNCPAEAPEGDSIADLSALCNAADP